MRTTSSLLVDHPALPLPLIGPARIGATSRAGINEAGLGAKERLRLAGQLMALTSLLTDFELWLPTNAIRNSIVVDERHGKQVIAGGYPVSLSRTYHRLGGGEEAVRVLRERAIRAVCDRFRIGSSDRVDDDVSPGFFLDAVCRRLLQRFDRPLDRQMAANLFAFRWDCPDLPEEGEIAYAPVSDERTARRIGAALCLKLRTRRQRVWHYASSADDGETAPFPVLGEAGTLVLTGEISEDEVVSVERWVHMGACNAVVVGVFPPRWVPDTTVIDTGAMRFNVALAGAPASSERVRFDDIRDPGELRFSLTEMARNLFSSETESANTAGDRVSGAVLDTLALYPEGLSKGFLSIQTGCKEEELNRLVAQLPVIDQGETLRLIQARKLEKNQQHAEIAALFERNDPRRLRHQYLAESDESQLAAWVDERLNKLEAATVRRLLEAIRPEDLAPHLAFGLIEACLFSDDPEGARQVLEGLSKADRQLCATWINSIDVPSGWAPEEVEWERAAKVPAARAEIAMAILRRGATSKRDDQAIAREQLETAVCEMSGRRRRWYEIEAAAMVDPRRLRDREWRSAMVGRDPQLILRLLFNAASIALKNRDFDRAHHLLTRCAVRVNSPGWLAKVYHDLSLVEFECDNEPAGIWHLAKAQRLFEIAGFKNRLCSVTFNLAISDIDHLDLDRAERRLDLAEGPVADVHSELARAHLALARGHDDDFRTRLKRAVSIANPEDHRIAEELAVLHGVDALFGGRPGEAERFFSDGGSEGLSWLNVVSALRGDSPIWPDQQWRLRTAAKLILEGWNSDSRAKILDVAATPAGALGVALCSRLTNSGPPAPISRTAFQTLESAGMHGWTKWLGAERGIEIDSARILVEMAESQDLSGVSRESIAGFLADLGLSGLEVRSRSGKSQWVIGSGAECQRARLAHFDIVPLGGEPPDCPAWKLFCALVELIAVPVADAEDPDVARTGIVGQSDQICHLRSEIASLAPSHVMVLLLGETGVGKEVAAHALHRLSGRKGSFVAVNIAGVPENLIEAELFGAVRGAYTGADRTRKGLVDTAEGGTLFLDEIGDMGLPLQVKLLRFLESYEVRAVGSDHTHTADVRVVAATHRDLEKALKAGQFREDLYYRISVAPIQIPPLRERGEDILLLRDHFERELCAQNGLQLCRWSRATDAVLRSYEWPGNVRQLKNVVERAIHHSRGAVIQPETLGISADPAPVQYWGTWDEAQTEFKRRYLRDALKRHDGNRSATARELGISRQALLYQIKALGLT